MFLLVSITRTIQIMRHFVDQYELFFTFEVLHVYMCILLLYWNDYS